jgi:hypothetical protein
VIGDELSTKATLYRDKSGEYQEKCYDIELKSAGQAKRVLARFSFDAASFCSLDVQRSTVKLHALNSKGKKDSFNTDTALTVSFMLCRIIALPLVCVNYSNMACDIAHAMLLSLIVLLWVERVCVPVWCKALHTCAYSALSLAKLNCAHHLTSHSCRSLLAARMCP